MFETRCYLASRGSAPRIRHLSPQQRQSRRCADISGSAATTQPAPLEVAMPGDVPDGAALLHVLGNELRRIRKQRGWIRRDVQARLTSDVSLQTLATYELGTRGIGVIRLVELCAVLEVSAPELLARSLQHVATPEHINELHLDLRRLVDEERGDLGPLRRWARVQLAARPEEPVSIHLTRPALDQLAELCGRHPIDLVASLHALRVRAS